MKKHSSNYGTVLIGSEEAIFEKITSFINDAATSGNASVALTGGSTPKAYYTWAAERSAFSPDTLDRLQWFTSDERCVPLESDESNFGNADRKMLSPMNVSDANKHPWPVDREPASAATSFNEKWNASFPSDSCFNVCLLGMGDDCHTASIFPGSPLITSDTKLNFASVDVPGKGWRLSITPAGLARCGRIVITVCGAGKTEALKRVFNEEPAITEKPVQLLGQYKDRVVWLMDEAAASGLGL